jgi:LytS/YehU family sensor histidine kinase
MHQSEGRKLRPEIAELGQEIAQFLSSYQIQLADLERRSEIASKAELRALQAQVHPHFLFNALNTVASLCETNPRKAADMAVNLGAYYRTALRRDGHVFVPLREELANVRQYLDIEQARFGDRLSATESIDGGLEDMPVPALSLQPLVENAVLHGLSARPGKGVLRIIIRPGRNRLNCWVIDNGVGMTGEQLGRALNRQREPHGLTILRNRLDKIYTGDFRLRLRSSPGAGTAVLLSIPLAERE